MIPEIDRARAVRERLAGASHVGASAEVLAEAVGWLVDDFPVADAHLQAVASHRNALMDENHLLRQQANRLLSEIADLEDRITDLEGDPAGDRRRIRTSPAGMLLVDDDGKTYFLTRWQRIMYRLFGVWPDP